jgi:H+/Cl- antiporter ClcA
MPTFLVGGLWGRLVGRIVDYAARSVGYEGVHVSSYALIGAVALTSGITAQPCCCKILHALDLLLK